MKRGAALSELFLGFVGIGAMSFGGGLVAWIRREAVQRRSWMDDTQFLTAYGLSQIVPGANNVNLAVFIGCEQRGIPGAVVAVAGLMLVPIVFYVAVGAIYLTLQTGPYGPAVGRVLGGMGAVAIGLNLATGYRLGKRSLRTAQSIAVAGATAIAVGILGVPLLWALLVLVPVSLGLAWARRRA
jgi:chromate transporter